MLADLTSTFTPWGVNVRDGMLLAAQEINDAGGVDGRMIEIIIQDSENDGNIGVDRFERLVDEGVVAVGGILSSGVGAPVGASAEQEQGPSLSGEIRYRGRPDAGQPLYLPYLSASRPDDCRADLAVRAGAGIHQSRGHRRRLPLGASV